MGAVVGEWVGRKIINEDCWGRVLVVKYVARYQEFRKLYPAVKEFF